VTERKIQVPLLSSQARLVEVCPHPKLKSIGQSSRTSPSLHSALTRIDGTHFAARIRFQVSDKSGSKRRTLCGLGCTPRNRGMFISQRRGEHTPMHVFVPNSIVDLTNVDAHSSAGGAACVHDWPNSDNRSENMTKRSSNMSYITHTRCVIECQTNVTVDCAPGLELHNASHVSVQTKKMHLINCKHCFQTKICSAINC
jgi:hypothetical protein